MKNLSECQFLDSFSRKVTTLTTANEALSKACEESENKLRRTVSVSSSQFSPLLSPSLLTHSCSWYKGTGARSEAFTGFD